MLFLTSIVDRPVEGKSGEVIGRLDDVIVRMGDDRYPPLSGLIVRDGRRRFFVAARLLQSINGAARLTSSTVDAQPFSRRSGEVLLRRDVLDHQLIDITGRRIVRVNDVQLTRIEGAYRVVGVDISPQALLRRLGPRAFAGRVVGRHVVDWTDVQYLASTAPVQLKVSYDRLAELHPVDLARIVDALSYRESAEIVAALHEETAAETLEEVPDPLLAVYVVEPEDPATLRGLVRLRTLILSAPATPVTEVMDEDLPTVAPEDRAENAARILAEYNLLAVPVLDEERHLLGIVTVDDALAVLLPEIWQRRGGRTFA